MSLMSASRCSGDTSNRMIEAGPPGARLTKKKVRALAKTITSAPNAMRWKESELLLGQPPFAGVMHSVAETQLRHPLERRAQHVDLLRVPEEEIRQHLGPVLLKL